MNKFTKSIIALCTGLLIMSITIIPKAQAQATFSDVPESHPFYQYITTLNQAGIIDGYSDGTFKPDNPVSRAAALKIIFGTANLSEVDLAPFPDVPAAEWFAKYIARAKEIGIVKGNPDGLFNPGDKVDKAAFFKMLLIANGIDVSKHEGLGSAVAADVAADAWFAPYLSYAKTVGIASVAQNGKLNPSKALTRGEVATFMARLLLLQQGGDTQKQLNVTESKLIEAINAIRISDIVNAEAAVNEAVAASGLALQQEPDEIVVQGAVKISLSFQQLIASYKAGINQQFDQAIELANTAKTVASEGASLFGGVKAIADQVTAFSDQVITEATNQVASGTEPTETTSEVETQIQAIQTRMQEITAQYNQAMTALQEQLNQLQPAQ